MGLIYLLQEIHARIKADLVQDLQLKPENPVDTVCNKTEVPFFGPGAWLRVSVYITSHGK